MDGFTGFNGVFGEGLATEQACMVHVRRKFVDVFERDGSTIAKETIERIAKLYAVEKEARYKPPDERVALRQTRAKPIFDELETWLKQQLPKISGKTSLAEARLVFPGIFGRVRFAGPSRCGVFRIGNLMKFEQPTCLRSSHPRRVQTFETVGSKAL